VQIDSVEEEFDRCFYYPTIKNVDFYEEGERILSSIDPEVTIPPSIMKRMKSGQYKYGK